MKFFEGARYYVKAYKEGCDCSNVDEHVKLCKSHLGVFSILFCLEPRPSQSFESLLFAMVLLTNTQLQFVDKVVCKTVGL